MFNRFTTILSLILTLCNGINAQKLNRISAGFPVNYSEDSVGKYILPDLLSTTEKNKITTAYEWEHLRRPQLLHQIEEIQFGTSPKLQIPIRYTISDTGTSSFNGLAKRIQAIVYPVSDTNFNIKLLLYLPSRIKNPAPVFLYISFSDNSCATSDSTVAPGKIWTKTGDLVSPHKPNQPAIPNIEEFIKNGIVVATFYYGNIEPDFKKGISFGIRSYFAKTDSQKYSWGAIAAWSWGLSRIMDFFEKYSAVDAKRVALMGISRLGKTALWTGARDTRYKVVIASCSGEGGAAISRRNYGENLLHITDTSRYYYQFADKYHQYASHVNDLPFDAHALVALMAPRPLLLQTGNTDYWSDPKGEYLSAIEAQKVYQLYGLNGPLPGIIPRAGDTGLLLNPLGYYIHEGGHGTVPSDWQIYLSYLLKFL